MFKIKCPHCHILLNSPDTLSGKNVKCPKCGKPFLVKIAEPPPAWVCAECGKSNGEPVQFYEEILCEQCAQAAYEIDQLNKEIFRWRLAEIICRLFFLPCLIICIILRGSIPNLVVAWVMMIGGLAVIAGVPLGSKRKRLENEIKKLEEKKEEVNKDTHTKTSDEEVNKDTHIKTSGWAVSSVLFFIFGIFTFGVLGILGIVTGILALRKIRREENRLKGRRLAILGIIGSSVCVIFFVIVIVIQLLG